MNIEIRLAKPADAREMAKIHARSWEAAYKDIIPPEYIKKKNETRPVLWQRIVTEDNEIHYVILSEGKTAGIMTVGLPQKENTDMISDSDIDGSFYELHGIYLDPDYYRQGIGRAAIEFALEKARSEGKSNMILWVFADNISSIEFYEKCGFTSDGATKTLNCGRELKAIRMRKKV